MADWLAKKGATMKINEECVFDYEPLCLKKLVHQDFVSIWCPSTSKLCMNSVDLVV